MFGIETGRHHQPAAVEIFPIHESPVIVQLAGLVPATVKMRQRQDIHTKTLPDRRLDMAEHLVDIVDMDFAGRKSEIFAQLNVCIRLDSGGAHCSQVDWQPVSGLVVKRRAYSFA